MIKPLVTATLVIASLCLTQCDAQTSTNIAARLATGSGPQPLPIGRYIRGDYDDDDNGGEDPDDIDTRTYGRTSTVASREAAEKVVRSYYIAAGKGDDVAVCRLMDKRLARSRNYAKAVPPKYAPAPGSSVFENKICSQIASLVIQPTRQQFARDATTVKLVELRVDKAHALAILISTADPESEIPLKREHGTWRIDAFLPTPLV